MVSRLQFGDQLPLSGFDSIGDHLHPLFFLLIMKSDSHYHLLH